MFAMKLTPLKALTLRGPLISEAIIRGFKKVENRNWKIPAGWCVLHSGAGKIKPDTLNSMIQNWPANEPFPPPDLPTKAIVAIVLMGESYQGTVRPEHEGWATGSVLNPILKVVRLTQPIFNVRGQLGLWNVEKVISREDYQLLLTLIKAHS